MPTGATSGWVRHAKNHSPVVRLSHAVTSGIPPQKEQGSASSPVSGHVRWFRSTLLTLLAALGMLMVIGVVITALGLGMQFSHTEEGKLSRTREELLQTLEDCEAFRERNGRWPSHLSELGEPRTDVWTMTQYRLSIVRGRPVVECAGFDGDFGTQDDLTTQSVRAMTIEAYVALIEASLGMAPRPIDD